MPKHIRDLLESQQEQIATLTQLLKQNMGHGGPDPTVSELCDTYEVECRGQFRKSGWVSKVSRLRNIKRTQVSVVDGKVALGTLRVSQVTPLVWERWQKARAGEVSESAVVADARVFKTVMRWAKKRGLCSKNPLEGAEMLYSIRQREAVLLPIQVEAACKWLQGQAKLWYGRAPKKAMGLRETAAAAMTIMSTGIRPFELHGMPASALSPTSRNIVIESERSKGGYSGRTVRLSVDAHAAWLALLDGRRTGKLMQVDPRRRVAYWADACRALGIKATGPDGGASERPVQYLARHSFASEGAARGQVFTLMKALGHANIATTQRYVKVSIKQTAELFEAVQAAQEDGDEKGSA